MEYALALNPNQQNATGQPSSRIDLIAPSAQSSSVNLANEISLFDVPTADLADGKHYQALTVTRNGIRADIDYIVEVSADLSNWQSGDPYTIKVLDTANTLEYYDATAMEDAPRRFMRLRIQRR